MMGITSTAMRVSNLPLMLFAAAILSSDVTDAVNNNNEATTSHRRLEDFVDEYAYDDLSQFSLHYDKCQDIKMYDDEIAAEGIEPFAFRSFVAFRICPSDTCGSCLENFGRYVVDIETYLAYTVQNRQQAFEEMCQNCEVDCNGDDADNCYGCGSVCSGYENLEAMGYVDASQFVECQRVNVQNDDDGNNNGEGDDAEEVDYYIGPRCSGGDEGNSQVTIGLFADENCYVPLNDVKVQDVLGYKLSYILLHYSLNPDKMCLSCSEDEYYNNANDQQDADNVNEMCENIYDAAAKCETPTGIQWGFMQDNKEEGNYQNQAESEFYACNFIQSIYWESYNNKGEINYKAIRDVYVREVTQNQTLALSLLALVVLSMAFAIRYLNSKIAVLTGVDGLAEGTFA